MATWVDRHPSRVMFIKLEAAPLTVQNLVRAFLHDVLLQCLESLRSRRCTVHGATQHFRALTVLYVIEAIGELKDLATVRTLDPDLVYYVVQVSILLLGHEGCLALAALAAALLQPLFDAGLMENLLAGGALDGTVGDA